MSRVLTYREALREAIAEEMERDDRVFLMGEEVGHYQGAYKVTEGLLERFGEKRIIDTPIAEAGFAGVGVGAAVCGLRPIIEFMTFNFSAAAFDQIVSHAAKFRQMSGGQFTCPIVFRGPNGVARQTGSQHSQCFEGVYAHFPGLWVVSPATPADAKGLLKSAIRNEDPVVFLEGERLYGMKGEVPDGEHLVPLGSSTIARAGTHVTVVSWGFALHVCLAAATKLAASGVELEVIDLRSLRPLDLDPVLSSVRKTHRAVVVHEHWPYGGPGAEVVLRIQDEVFDWLDAPVARVASVDVPMPYASVLEESVIPTAERVIEAVRKVTYAA